MISIWIIQILFHFFEKLGKSSILCLSTCTFGPLFTSDFPWVCCAICEIGRCKQPSATERAVTVRIAFGVKPSVRMGQRIEFNFLFVAVFVYTVSQPILFVVQYVSIYKHAVIMYTNVVIGFILQPLLIMNYELEDCYSYQQKSIEEKKSIRIRWIYSYMIQDIRMLFKW